MKNNQEKAAMTAAEKLGEALVLKPEWEVKPRLRLAFQLHLMSRQKNCSWKLMVMFTKLSNAKIS